jgi:methanogenic corrinoid protein MtbC1
LGTTDLAQALGDLQESEVIAGVEAELSAGKDPMAILAEVQAGMEIVGKRFEEGEYYLSELLYAADIFKKVNAPLAERLQGRESETLATMVLGTVKNDIHEFGKDIVATILTSNGVKVIDLGIDVDYEKFVAAIREHRPQFVGLSCMLTTVFSDMKATIEAIEQAGLRDSVQIYIGGGPVDESLAEHVGADVYCRTAQDAVVAMKKYLGVS